MKIRFGLAIAAAVCASGLFAGCASAASAPAASQNPASQNPASQNPGSHQPASKNPAGFTARIGDVSYPDSTEHDDGAPKSCLTKPNDTVVESYRRASAPGDPAGQAEIRCGKDTSSGLEHIDYRHEKDWGEVSGGKVGWWAIADFAIAQTLAHPDHTYGYSGNIVDYVAYLTVQTGGTSARYEIKVGVGKRDNIVITSFPDRKG